jgi:hypothetical protein
MLMVGRQRSAPEALCRETFNTEILFWFQDQISG